MISAFVISLAQMSAFRSGIVPSTEKGHSQTHSLSSRIMKTEAHCFMERCFLSSVRSPNNTCVRYSTVRMWEEQVLLALRTHIDIAELFL